MFENIGGKIRTLARLIFLIGVVLSGIAMISIWITGGGSSGMGGFSVFLYGLLAGALGCLCSWVSALFTYGFGKLIEDTEAVRHNTEDTQYHADALRRMGEERRRDQKQAAEG
ncbi:MAG: hypothetical protein IJ646_03500 [Clostridia bacterium]|nr:hypothetical protein [Clostridia bacterium]